MTTIGPTDAMASLLPPTGPSAITAASAPTTTLELLEAATWRVVDADAVVGSDARLHALRLADQPTGPCGGDHRVDRRAVGEADGIEQGPADERDDDGSKLGAAGRHPLPVRSARELAHPVHRRLSLRGVGHPVAPSVQGADDRSDHVGAVGKGGREATLLPSSAHPVDELLLARLAVNARLHEREDRKAATQRLLELLLGRAHAALARLAVLGAEQQQVSVAGRDLVNQAPGESSGRSPAGSRT
jgi:hypothetical protein